jgi:hypothetical protein
MSVLNHLHNPLKWCPTGKDCLAGQASIPDVLGARLKDMVQIDLLLREKGKPYRVVQRVLGNMR